MVDGQTLNSKDGNKVENEWEGGYTGGLAIQEAGGLAIQKGT